MSLAANPLIPKDGAIVLSDGSGTPKTLSILYEDGDLSLSGWKNGNMATQIFKARGIPYSVRKTETQEVEIAFTAHAVGFIDASDGSIPSMIMQSSSSPYSAAVSTIPSGRGDGYLLQLVWTGERTSYGGTGDAVVTLKYCDLEWDFSEGVPGKFSVKGKAIMFPGTPAAIA